MGWKARYKKWDRRLREKNLRKWEESKQARKAALKIIAYSGLLMVGVFFALVGFIALIRILGGG